MLECLLLLLPLLKQCSPTPLDWRAFKGNIAMANCFQLSAHDGTSMGWEWGSDKYVAPMHMIGVRSAYDRSICCKRTTSCSLCYAPCAGRPNLKLLVDAGSSRRSDILI